MVHAKWQSVCYLPVFALEVHAWTSDQPHGDLPQQHSIADLADSRPNQNLAPLELLMSQPSDPWQTPQQPTPGMPQQQPYQAAPPQQFGGSLGGSSAFAPTAPPLRRRFQFTRFGLIAVIIGAVLGFIAYQSFTLSSKSKATPQVMTVEQLIINGPGDNLYIELSEIDFMSKMDDAVVESPENNEAKFTKVWYPVAAADPATGMPKMPQPQGRDVVVVFKDAESEAELMREIAKTTLTGMVVNDIRSLGSKEAKLLAEGNIDTDKCYLFEVGMTPDSSIKSMGLVLGAVICIALGVFLFFPKS